MAKTGHDVLLVRHGQTEWSLNGRHTGTTDVPLTEEGRRQAREVGQRLLGRDLRLVLSSPLSRALETARLAGLGDRVQVREDLVEWDYGRYEGATTPDIRRERPGWYLFRDGCPGGETAAEVGTRAERVIAELSEAGGDAAVFGHGHCLRVLAARFLELAAQEGGRLGLTTGTVSVLGYEHERPAVWLWNGGGPEPV
jgi:broad specificity phosphatase PhoE